MITMQSDIGPFALMDRIGLGVVHHVARLIGATYSAHYLDEEFIQNGRLGVAARKGFYAYPNPAFAQPGFIGTMP